MLQSWIRSGELDEVDLSFAAEEIGKRWSAELFTLLEHSSPVVREGAVLGLDHLANNIRQKLEDIGKNDPSPGVRMAAQVCAGFR